MKIALIYPVAVIDPDTMTMSEGYFLAPDNKKENYSYILYKTQRDVIREAHKKGFTHIEWAKTKKQIYKI